MQIYAIICVNNNPPVQPEYIIENIRIRMGTVNEIIETVKLCECRVADIFTLNLYSRSYKTFRTVNQGLFFIYLFYFILADICPQF